MEKQPPWPPFDTKDCSQAYCSYYCPQWCFFYFPPPTHNQPKGPTHPILSPLLISIIAISSTAFVLIAYYLILSRYRAHRAHSLSLPSSPHPDSWLVSHGDGLDETMIKKIALHRYRTGGGLVRDGSDCSVCLTQFEDGDTLRLLPKCGHAFHATCIDRWLTSHSTCPLCRAGIFPAPACNNSSDDVAIVISLVEDVGDRRGVLGRSFSMDSPFRRQRTTDVNTDVNRDVNSSGWSRSLHSVISPVRMKRASSMRYTTGVGRSRVLLPT